MDLALSQGTLVVNPEPPNKTRKRELRETTHPRNQQGAKGNPTEDSGPWTSAKGTTSKQEA